MLRANVGLSRKVSRDFQSTGYTVNLDGEIPFPADDAEGVLEKIRELFDLANEALGREIDRDQGDTSIGRRDEAPRTPAPPAKPASNGRHHAEPPAASLPPAGSQSRADGNGSPAGQGSRTEEAATNKQVQFILTMGKKFKLTAPQLENRIVEIVGRKCGVYDLTKKEAGRVLDQWTSQPAQQLA